MIDTHYDLLSISYVCYLNNDYTKIIKYIDEIRKSGVKCIFANLYFMNEEEMKYELHDNYYNSNTSILDMFKTSKSVLEYYAPDIDFIYSIEGCDYLDINELDDLYNNGLRSILLVWNNQNKYGSGIRGNSGLTNMGIDFLNKAIDLGIGIDVSHTNERTFYDIVNLIKEKNNKDVLCYASHSNARSLKDIKRNLKDEQIKSLKSINGYIGVISNIHFMNLKDDDNYEYKRKEYLKHIIYISNIIGINNVMLSTDDMRFASDNSDYYLYAPIYKYETIKEDIENDLLTYFNEEETNKILYKNASGIVKKLKR